MCLDSCSVAFIIFRLHIVHTQIHRIHSLTLFFFLSLLLSMYRVPHKLCFLCVFFLKTATADTCLNIYMHLWSCLFEHTHMWTIETESMHYTSHQTRVPRKVWLLKKCKHKTETKEETKKWINLSKHRTLIKICIHVIQIQNIGILEKRKI